jgi:hypothetical protein
MESGIGCWRGNNKNFKASHTSQLFYFSTLFDIMAELVFLNSKIKGNPLGIWFGWLFLFVYHDRTFF